MSTWSGIRNKLENDYLCPALQGHIQYVVISYSKSAGNGLSSAVKKQGVPLLQHILLGSVNDISLIRGYRQTCLLPAFDSFFWKKQLQSDGILLLL